MRQVERRRLAAGVIVIAKEVLFKIACNAQTGTYSNILQYT